MLSKQNLGLRVREQCERTSFGKNLLGVRLMRSEPQHGGPHEVNSLREIFFPHRLIGVLNFQVSNMTLTVFFCTPPHASYKQLCLLKRDLRVSMLFCMWGKEVFETVFVTVSQQVSFKASTGL